MRCAGRRVDRPSAGLLRHGLRITHRKGCGVAVTDPTVFYDAETMAAQALVNQLSVQLDNRIGYIDRWQRYYDGVQPLKFASPEYQKHFGNQYAGFRDNWCAPVADTT